MKLYNLQRTQLIGKSRNEVFAFFSRPENLASLTPSDLGFSILTPAPVRMNEGALIDYTIKIAGMNVHWTTLISHYDPPNRFVDVQLKGPYSFWHHTHEFVEVAGGTEMTDSVRYGIPFGVLGMTAHGLFVRRQLEEIFSYREERLKEVFPVGRRSSQVSRNERRRSKKQ